MSLSKTELRMLEQIAGGNKAVKDIAIALKRSKAQIYRSGYNLSEKGFIVRSEGVFKSERTTHVTLLLHLLSDYPSLITPLAGSGTSFFTALLEPKTISEIMRNTGIKRTMVFKKLKQARGISLVVIKNGKYSLNEKVWPGVKEFLIELKKYEETTDKRVPESAIIYFKNEKEIVFSSKEETDAVLTGFSAYAQYGIKILSPVYDYYLPKKKLTRKEVFKHSLYIADKDKSIRILTYVALFYIKYKKELSSINHGIIGNIDAVLQGRTVPGYPSLAEIKEKAELYDIRL